MTVLPEDAMRVVKPCGTELHCTFLNSVSTSRHKGNRIRSTPPQNCDQMLNGVLALQVIGHLLKSQ